MTNLTNTQKSHLKKLKEKGSLLVSDFRVLKSFNALQRGGFCVVSETPEKEERDKVFYRVTI